METKNGLHSYYNIYEGGLLVIGNTHISLAELDVFQSEWVKDSKRGYHAIILTIRGKDIRFLFVNKNIRDSLIIDLCKLYGEAVTGYSVVELENEENQ